MRLIFWSDLFLTDVRAKREDKEVTEGVCRAREDARSADRLVDRTRKRRKGGMIVVATFVRIGND